MQTTKKFRAEILREQYLNQLNGRTGQDPGDANMAAHRETQQAIAELAEALKSQDSSGSGFAAETERLIQEKVVVENELRSLSEALDDTKREIAGLRYSSVGNDRIVSMNAQLDAIVAEAEGATNKILAAAEIIDDHLQQMHKNASDDDEFMVLDKMGEETIKIFEACNFQDLTGQRITKVVEALKQVESRVDSMIRGLGGDENAFAELVEQEEKRDGEIELAGPQNAGETNTQADIDALFD